MQCHGACRYFDSFTVQDVGKSRMILVEEQPSRSDHSMAQNREKVNDTRGLGSDMIQRQMEMSREHDLD